MIEKLQEIMVKMNEIQYGYVDNNENIYPDNTENWNTNFGKIYRLQSPKELTKSKYGVCWDQVELERYYFEENNINARSYFIVEYDYNMYPTHTFMVICDKDKYYWFEHSWEPFRGIHLYNSLDELLNDVKNKFCKKKNKNNTVIYEYDKPTFNITCNQFYKHCEGGKKYENI